MTKREIRFFNTTGPCNPDDHYMLAPEDRLMGAQLYRYIKDKLYWILHAPRQTGKTTFLQSWMREINSGSEAIACYVSVERCQGISEPKEAMPEICEAIKKWAKQSDLPVPNIDINMKAPSSMLNDILVNWAQLVAPKPLIVLFDEVDVLVGDTMISFLRQLRDGFAGRGIGKFPISIALVGMRDLKDYITAAKGGVKPNPGSPFNIKADSAVLANFNKDDVAKLFAQRTQETGQKITQEALDYIYEQSKGQPWIVNSLFARATLRILDESSKETVTKELIKEAREQMILARETHLDALAYRLDEPRVFKVIETLMTGEPDPKLSQSDGFRYCLDLGLVVREDGTPTVANPIYREVLARQISQGSQDAMSKPEWEWKKPDGCLDMGKLIKEFQKFWRENSEVWEEKSDYTEAFPHLLLQAFLQRVLNGGGQIDREYAAGRGRLDLCVEYNKKRYIIEVKMLRDYNTIKQVKEKGFKQIAEYRDTVAPKAPAYLVIFDRRSKKKKATWSKRITWTKAPNRITVVGC
ncbi:MAG: PD-(D/E)XK nuclease domain-containing protein [Elusimicrobiota bacterium]|jgi:hypothetical protein|nr:PD-(D/E)XK nuclease domain-containing protein [Elusimicrobiota bacterium]